MRSEGDLRVLNLKKEMNRETVLAHPNIVRLAGCRRNLMCFAWLRSAMDQGQCWVVEPQGAGLPATGLRLMVLAEHEALFKISPNRDPVGCCPDSMGHHKEK